jgi:predicted GNAT family acetyltransferase
MFGWMVGDQLVSQLGCSAERYGVTRIGGVFTPAELQGHGYASALTSAVSREQQARRDIDEVTLNTQASNPGTNRLYRRLGFEPVAELLVVSLRTSG